LRNIFICGNLPGKHCSVTHKKQNVFNLRMLGCAWDARLSWRIPGSFSYLSYPHSTSFAGTISPPQQSSLRHVIKRCHLFDSALFCRYLSHSCKKALIPSKNTAVLILYFIGSVIAGLTVSPHKGSPSHHHAHQRTQFPTSYPKLTK